MFWMPRKRADLRIRIGAKKSFYDGEGEKNRMEPNLSGASPKPNPDAKAVGNTIAAGERGRAFKAEKRRRRRRQAQASPAGGARVAKAMGKGEYLATSYGETMYRGAEKTVFFLLLLGEKGEPITDAEVPDGAICCKRRRKKCNCLKTMDV